MPETFAITTTTTTAPLDSKRQGSVGFTVSNTSGRALRARARIVPANPVAAPWLTVDGATERPLPPAGTEQYTVLIVAPSTAPAGTYSFRVDVVGVDNPDEELTQGPSVTFTVPEPAPAPKPFPWWIVAVAGGALLLLIIGVVVFLVVQDNNQKAAVAMHFDGDWVLASGSLRLGHSGGTVSGPYTDTLDNLIGTVQGTVVSPTLTGQATLPGHPPASVTMAISQADTLLLGLHPLCGAKVGVAFPAGCGFAGAWESRANTTNCPLNLIVTDRHVTGSGCQNLRFDGNVSYPGASGLKVAGVATIGALRVPNLAPLPSLVSYSYSGASTGFVGGKLMLFQSFQYQFDFFLNADATQFQGTITFGSVTDPWCGQRAGHPPPAQCLP